MEVENGMLYWIMDIDMDMVDHFKRTPACWGRSNLCCFSGSLRRGIAHHSTGDGAVPLTWFRS